MAGKAAITFASSALEDLGELKAYYAQEGSPEAGMRIVAEIVGSIERLSAFPLSVRIVPEFNVPHLREIISPPFRIVYRHERSTVRIVRIWRSERLVKRP